MRARWTSRTSGSSHPDRLSGRADRQRVVGVSEEKLPQSDSYYYIVVTVHSSHPQEGGGSSMNLVSAAHVPVLIVGAGAGGLATSALLAKHGVDSLLVEKRREVFIYPKARNLSFRSLEILRGLGLADQVHAVADRVSDMVVKPTLNSAEEKLAIDIDAVFAGLDQLSPEPSVQYCPQSSLEPMLLAETRRRGSEVRYGTELRSFEQDDAGVTAVLRDLHSGESQTVRADFLVAADGVHSKIRESLDVTTSGYGALPIFVVFIYFRAPWRKFVPHLSEGDGVQIKNPDVDGIFLVAKDDL